MDKEIFKMRKGTFFYIYDDNETQRYRQSRIEIDSTFNTYIQIFGHCEEPVDESSTKRHMISALRRVLDFKQYILVLSQKDGRVKLQFHCILQRLPNLNELEAIQKICTTYELE